MPDLSIALKFIIALVLGAVIGLERESLDLTNHRQKNKKTPHSIGVRSLSLVAALGSLSGVFISDNYSIFFLISLVVSLLLIAYYILNSLITKDVGITTELAIFFSYLIGVFVGQDIFPLQIILAITTIVVLVLSRKEDIRNLIFGIKRKEINAFVSYALIALVILPFLPNRSLSLNMIPGLTAFFDTYGLNLGLVGQIEIINLARLWQIVALITGIDMAGYLLEKTIGQNKGRLLTSLIGGFISSTATTQSLAQESKKNKNTDFLVGAALLANASSFIPLFFFIAPLNTVFLTQVTPILICLTISALILGLIFTRIKNTLKDKKTESAKESEIFAIKPALRFAGIFLAVRLVTKLSLVYFGNSGFLVSSSLAALTGIDAVVINIAELAGKSINYQTALQAFILINGINLISKTFYSYLQGKKEFAIKFGLSAGAVIVFSIIISIL